MKSDNFFFGSGVTPDCYTCDFQLSTICNPARDVAYFFIVNLSPKDRREWMRELGSIYLEALSRNGVEGYTMGRLMSDLRTWVLWPLIMDIACGSDLLSFYEGLKVKEREGGVTEDDENRNLRNKTHRERLFAALADFEAEQLVATLKKDSISCLPFFGCCCCWWA